MVREDRELVALLKTGDAEALEQLITRRRAGAEAYARGILHDSQAAEDAVQEAFSRIYALRADCSAGSAAYAVLRLPSFFNGLYSHDT